MDAKEMTVEAEPLMNDFETGTRHILSTQSTAQLTKLKVHYLLNVVLTLMVLFLTAIIFVREHGAAPFSQCSPECNNYYSPALEATWTGSHVVRPVVTKNTPVSPFNHGTMEDMDSNWTSLLRVGFMGLTDEELEKVGAPTNSVRLPAESGGGYMAYLASHHHLHCLYLLHQSLYPDWYETRSEVWNMSARLRQSHWDHCVDELRDYVMCHADSTVVTYEWMEGVKSPLPQQGNARVCANWDGHFQWQLDRQVPAPKTKIMRPAEMD
ncbi:protein of unknown function (DUF3328) domain containing protein [Rhypophila decipiens]